MLSSDPRLKIVAMINIQRDCRKSKRPYQHVLGVTNRSNLNHGVLCFSFCPQNDHVIALLTNNQYSILSMDILF